MMYWNSKDSLTKASRYSLDVSLANHNEIVQKVIESIFHGSHRIEIILSYVISPVHCLQSHSFLHHFEKSLSGDRQIKSNLPIYERAPFQLLSLAVLTVFRKEERKEGRWKNKEEGGGGGRERRRGGRGGGVKKAKNTEKREKGEDEGDLRLKQELL